MVVDPDHDVSKERERSVSASAATRLPLSSRTGARLELRSNQEVRRATPRRTWRAADEEVNLREASGSLKRPQRLTWNDLNALQGRACLTERHIPQTCLAMLGGLLRRMLVDQGSTETEPSLADYIFVLPKLIWPKPLLKARRKTRVRNINERMALVQQGKWKTPS